ncbi:hypothetical protein [Streptomyces harbinensis]|uniref:hypothetical protein n=1 Tax=Streptomyces harbinensis TaxID=1176198 RepID=UPI0034DECD91
MTNVKPLADNRVTGEPTVLEDSHITSEPKGGKVKPLEDSHITSEPAGGKVKPLEDSHITSEPLT